MRAKFGSSSGLSSSSGGVMQGIGSDSSYCPSDKNTGFGISTDDISAQVSGAFSYLSSAIESGAKVRINGKVPSTRDFG